MDRGGKAVAYELGASRRGGIIAHCASRIKYVCAKKAQIIKTSGAKTSDASAIGSNIAEGMYSRRTLRKCAERGNESLPSA